MKTFLGLRLSTHIYANITLVSLLALRVHEGIAPSGALLVGVLSLAIAYAALLLRYLISPPKAERLTLQTQFPWHKFLIGNAINVAGLGLLYSDGLSPQVFLLATVLSLGGANAVFFWEWRSTKRGLYKSEPSMPARG